MKLFGIVCGGREVARLGRAGEPILAEWTKDLVVVAGKRSALGTIT